MADTPEEYEKTEEPSQKKLEDARKKGDVAKSQEVTSWFMMSAATLVIMVFLADGAGSLGVSLKTFLSEAHDLPMDGPGLRRLTYLLGVAVLAALGLPLLIMMRAGIAGNLVQHAPLLSAESLKPKLSKISPWSGSSAFFRRAAW